MGKTGKEGRMKEGRTDGHQEKNQMLLADGNFLFYCRKLPEMEMKLTKGFVLGLKL